MVRLPTKAINSEAAKITSTNAATGFEAQIFDLPAFKKNGTRDSSMTKNPYVVLKYFQKDWQCFSDWDKDELANFSSFLSTLSGHTWESVYKSGGKGSSKVGLGYTQYRVNDMKAGDTYVKKVLTCVSEDINLFELRVSRKMRVHGFQCGAAFFLILLDREHAVFPAN
jgi:hypothetical protein